MGGGGGAGGSSDSCNDTLKCRLYLGGSGGAGGAGDGRLQVPDEDAGHLEGEAALASHLCHRHRLTHPVYVLHLLL